MGKVTQLSSSWLVGSLDAICLASTAFERRSQLDPSSRTLTKMNCIRSYVTPASAPLSARR